MKKSTFHECCFAAMLPHLLLVGFVVSTLRGARGLPDPQLSWSPYAGVALVEAFLLVLAPWMGLTWLAAVLASVSTASALLGYYYHKAT